MATQAQIISSWRHVLEKNTALSPAWDRQQRSEDVSCPICLCIKSITGVSGPKEKTEGTEVEYSVNTSLFDLHYNQFFGNTWKGPLVKPQFDDEKISVPYQQNVYFHTVIKDPALIIALEVVRHQTVKNCPEEQVSCGWLFIRPFVNVDELTDVGEGKPNTQQVSLYYGSPRALLFLEDPLDKNKDLKTIDGCTLTYSVETHQALEKAMHIIPENALVSGRDVIPGIDEAPKKQGQAGDSLRKPRLSKKMPCYIENIVISLPPSVEKFEEELCKQLNDDRLRRDDKPADGTAVSVIERRLQVGVHNGWSYIDKPQVFHLTTDAVQDKHKRGHKRTASFDLRNAKNAAASGLVLKNRVELDSLIEDPLCSVVFKLEYVVAEPLSKQQRKSSMVRAQNITACVRWLAWCPCSESGQSELSLEMVGGPSIIPDQVLVYGSPKRSDSDDVTGPGMIKFKFVNQRKISHSSLSVPGQYGEEEIMDRMSVAQVASEMPLSLPPESPSPRRPPSAPGRRYDDMHMSPGSPRHMIGRESMTPYMTSPYMMSYPNGSGMMYPQGPMGYPMHMSQTFNEPPMSARTAGDLQEVPYMTQPHQPIVALGANPHSGSTLSRAAYARLYSVGFPAILDRNGETPEVLDPSSYVHIDFQKEQYDSLQGNEITVQFLAFTRASSFMPTEMTSTDKPRTIFFTFQFYRFPGVTTERLLLGDAERELSVDNQGLPCVLRKLDKQGGIKEKELPGYELKYSVDPNFLKPGECRLFIQHLSQQTLHIDVWDGESLLLIGTSTVELKNLLRQGQESVQVTYELDVISTEYADDTTPNLTGDLTRSGSVRPVGVSTALKGRLHLRLANCGFPTERGSIKDVISSHQEPKTQITPDQANMSFRGGSLTSTFTPSKARNSYRAQPLAETNNELASMLTPAEKDEGNIRMDPVKQRKLARMQAVRTANGLENQQPLSFRSLKADKAERTRALKTIDIYRDQSRPESIINMLNRSISTDHTIYPSMGSTEFFEFSLKNPYNVPHTVAIVVKDPELSVVTDVKEWRFYKNLYNLTSPIEENMFSTETKSDFAEVYLRPKEKVNIPFKFFSLVADHQVKPEGPVDPFRPIPRNSESNKSNNTQKARSTQVYFVTDDDKPISILNINIASQPHVVNQTFRFHHPEQTFFKKAIRLPPFHHNLPGHPVNGEGVSQVYVRSSDSNVICEAKSVQNGEPQDVFIKVACGHTPEIKKFYLAVYNNPFMARPQQIWQFYIHALQRVEVCCTEGQMTKFTLILRGTQASRNVRCHSSNPLELVVQPADQFMLAANTIHELQLSVCSRKAGSKYLYVNVVDCEYHQLIRTWMLYVTCKPPVVSKAFELQLPCGGGRGSNKRITYTNPYAQRRKFTLHTNRDDLLQFREQELDIGANETATLGLRFNPCLVAGTAEIMIFINDCDQKTEETFCIKACYS